MKSITILIFTCSLFTSCKSCNDNLNEEKQPLEPYVWRGRLYKGMCEEPYAGAIVTLVGEPSSRPKNLIDLAIDTTAADGSFELRYNALVGTYSAIDSRIILAVNGDLGSSFIAPWNVNVIRDWCQTPFATVNLRLTNSNPSLLTDTLFISGFLPTNVLDGKLKFSQWIVNSGQMKRFITINPIKDTLISFKYSFASDYLYTPMMYTRNYGTSRMEIDQIMSAYHDDNDDSEFKNQFQFKLIGWPNNDTINIEL